MRKNISNAPLEVVSCEEELANEQVLFYLYGMWMEVRDLVYPSYTSRTCGGGGVVDRPIPVLHFPFLRKGV